MFVASENRRILGRNLDKRRVNGGFQLLRIYAERDKERVKS